MKQKPKHPPSVREKLFVIVFAGLALALAVLWTLRSGWFATNDTGLLTANGRIEGRITTVTPEAFGRVVQLDKDEGQPVVRGEVLTVLDDVALRDRIQSLKARCDALAEHLRAAEVQLELLRREVPLEIAQAQTALNEARAQVDRTAARLEQARRDAQRYANLAAAAAASRLQAENMRLSVVVEEKALVAARETQARAEKQLALARLGGQRIATQDAQRDAVAAQLKQAEAQLAEQQGILERFAIKSPLDGVILTRAVERGEWVNAGVPLFTVVDLDQLYLKVYIPEPQIGKVALGQEAQIYVDAYPDRAFQARVSKVAQQAEFTPKNVETREERVKLVFAVELRLKENPGGVLKPGMPADGVIRWREGAPWVRP